MKYILSLYFFTIVNSLFNTIIAQDSTTNATKLPNEKFKTEAQYLKPLLNLSKQQEISLDSINQVFKVQEDIVFHNHESGAKKIKAIKKLLENREVAKKDVLSKEQYTAYKKWLSELPLEEKLMEKKSND